MVFRYLVSCRYDYDLLISDEKLWNTFEIRELKVVMDGGVEFAFCGDEVVFGGGVKNSWLFFRGVNETVPQDVSPKESARPLSYLTGDI